MPILSLFSGREKIESSPFSVNDMGLELTRDAILDICQSTCYFALKELKVLSQNFINP